MSEIKNAFLNNNGIDLEIKDMITGTVCTDRYDGVILATGFKNIGTSDNDVRIHPS